jgi:dTDP-glucose pyrophosphorylase
MSGLSQSLLHEGALVRDAVRALESSEKKLVLVVDESQGLRGTVTDGDVRRGLIRGLTLDDPVTAVMNTAPASADSNADRDELVRLMRSSGVAQMPLVDARGRVVAIETLVDLLQPSVRDNPVVLMAGGFGTRLRPLTEDRPKPLIRVGPKPILETLLESFVAAGFRRFYISVNYRAAMIEEHFGDGSRWDSSISYLREEAALGTAGALGLLPERPALPFIVMNGDLLTRVRFGDLLSFHEQHGAAATMCVREYENTVPYGVVELDQHRIARIVEKPTTRCFVNAGIYVLDPQVLDQVVPGQRLDMTALFERVQEAGGGTAAFPLREYWMDIGRMEDLAKAVVDFERGFPDPD